MSQQLIAVGSYDFDPSADVGREGGIKINDNFTELYNRSAVISPLAYGAVADGTTDDTTAWTDAYNALAALTPAGGILLAPPGTSVVSAWPTFAVPILVMGQPGNRSVIHCSATSGSLAVFDWTGTTAPTNQYSYGPGLRDLVLDGNAGTSIGITLGGSSGCQGFHASNVQVQGFATGVLGVSNSFLWTFDHCIFRGNTQQISLPSGITNAGENCRFLACTFANSGTVAAAVQQASSGPWQVRYTNCSFDNAQLAIAAGTAYCAGCHFENPGVTGDFDFIAQTGGDLQLLGCTFRQSDPSATITEFVSNTGGTSVAFGCRYSSASATIARAVVVNAAARHLSVGTTVLFNVTTDVATTSTGVANTWMPLQGNYPPVPFAPNTALTDAATVAVDASVGKNFHVSVTASRSMGIPTNAHGGQELTIRVFNNSGGAVTTTWPNTTGGYNLAGTWVDPANGKNRTISFIYSATSSTWIESSRTAADA